MLRGMLRDQAQRSGSAALQSTAEQHRLNPRLDSDDDLFMESNHVHLPQKRAARWSRPYSLPASRHRTRDA